MTFDWGTWLDGRMAQLGVSATELARQAGVPDSVVSRWRRQGVRPEIALLRRIAGPLRVDLLELLVLAGHLEAAEVVGSVPDAEHPLWVSVTDALEHAPELDDDLRQLLVQQYLAMANLTRARRTGERIEHQRGAQRSVRTTGPSRG